MRIIRARQINSTVFDFTLQPRLFCSSLWFMRRNLFWASQRDLLGVDLAVFYSHHDGETWL
jgi:hypothetical protein